MSNDRSQNAPQEGRGAAWQLARHIQNQIVTGVYAPGSRLPTHRELMAEHDLTQGTVSYAMSILSVQGHVERRQGSGVFVRSAETSSAAAQQETGLIALVVPEIESGRYAPVLAGLEYAARRNREHLITVSTGGSSNKQADVLMQLIDREVDGIVLVPAETTTCGYQLRHLHKVNLPLVLLHSWVDEVSAPLVEIPSMEIGRLAGQALHELGHRNVGAVLERHSVAAEKCLAGLKDFAQSRGRKIDDDAVAWCDVSTDAKDREVASKQVENEIVSVLNRSDRPTAIFSSSYQLGCDSLLVALRLGLRIPQDISIICSASLHDKMGTFRISSITVDEYQGGRQAYELIGAMRRGEQPIDRQEAFPMSISINLTETCGPAPT